MFGRKRCQDVNGNKKLFWKEDSWRITAECRIQDGKGRLSMEKFEVFGRIIYNIDTKEQVAVHMWGFVWGSERQLLQRKPH